MLLNDKTYNVMKWLAIVFWPALTVLVGAVGGRLGWAPTETVVFIMTAFQTFIGALLGLSDAEYKRRIPME